MPIGSRPLPDKLRPSPDAYEAGKPRALIYNGGTPKYVARINDVAAKGYEGVTMRKHDLKGG